jgi:hypothetical protein
MRVPLHHLVRPRVLLLAAFSGAVALCVAATAGAYHTRFIATYCNYDAPQWTATYTRDAAASYALAGSREGYQWGGGCWNNDNIDNSPNDPPTDPNTGGEGPDCSGFTFKVWRESESTSLVDFYWWNKFRYVHGPYTAQSFLTGIGAPNIIYPKTDVIRMDALASSTHVGMIYAVNPDGTDQMIEAKGEAYGTRIWTRSYRSNPAYDGARRLGWS